MKNVGLIALVVGLTSACAPPNEYRNAKPVVLVPESFLPEEYPTDELPTTDPYETEPTYPEPYEETPVEPDPPTEIVEPDPIEPCLSSVQGLWRSNAADPAPVITEVTDHGLVDCDVQTLTTAQQTGDYTLEFAQLSMFDRQRDTIFELSVDTECQQANAATCEDLGSVVTIPGLDDQPVCITSGIGCLCTGVLDGEVQAYPYVVNGLQMEITGGWNTYDYSGDAVTWDICVEPFDLEMGTYHWQLGNIYQSYQRVTL